MTDLFTPAPERVAQAKALYDAGAPVTPIAEMLGMNRWQFIAWRNANGWPLRAQIATPYRYAPKEIDDRDDGFAEEDGAPPRPDDMKPAAMIARLERVVERELRRVEKSPGRISWRIMEARARVMASLVKTLEAVTRLRRERDAITAQDASSNEPKPRSLEELRAILRERIERFQNEGACD